MTAVSFLASRSPLSSTTNGSWLSLLILPASTSIRHNSSKAEEPHPQRNNSAPDPLVMYWQHADISASQKGSVERRRDNQSLVERSLAARRNIQHSEQEQAFWENRLKLLKREEAGALEHAERLKRSSEPLKQFNISNATIVAQLEAERLREQRVRRERAEAIKIQRAENKRAIHDAQRAVLDLKLDAGKQLKNDSVAHKVIMQTAQTETYRSKCKLREKVQQEKVSQLLKRVRDRAMHSEETRRQYEMRIEQEEEEEARHQSHTLQLIQESSTLVRRIRQLRQNESTRQQRAEAVRSVSTMLYSPDDDPVAEQ